MTNCGEATRFGMHCHCLRLPAEAGDMRRCFEASNALLFFSCQFIPLAIGCPEGPWHLSLWTSGIVAPDESRRCICRAFHADSLLFYSYIVFCFLCMVGGAAHDKLGPRPRVHCMPIILGCVMSAHINMMPVGQVFSVKLHQIAPPLWEKNIVHGVVPVGAKLFHRIDLLGEMLHANDS